jgi:hypothetical protein
MIVLGVGISCWGVVLRFSFGMISGILPVICWIVLAPVQCMTQVFPLMLRCLRSLRVGTGTGHLPGSILLWKIQSRLPEILIGGEDLAV